MQQALQQAVGDFAGRLLGKEGCLAQVWVPSVESDGSVCLTTQGQPYCVGGLGGDLLALFRCVSCRYRFAIGPPPSAYALGSVGRVFSTGEPEMSHNVQQYDRNTYVRAGEARRCRVHASLFMPLYANTARTHPLAVFEVAQPDRDVAFPSLVDCLISCLKGTGLCTSDLSVHGMAVGMHSAGEETPMPLLGSQLECLSGATQHLSTAMPPLLDEQPLSVSAAPSASFAEASAQLGATTQQAASHGRSEDSSESCQPSGKRLRSATAATEARVVTGHAEGISNLMQRAFPQRRPLRGCASPSPADFLRPASAPSLRSDSSSGVKAPVTKKKQETAAAEEQGVVGNGMRLTLQQLQAQFGLDLRTAAARLGVCATTLKRACRRNGIARWPRRPTLRPLPRAHTASDASKHCGAPRDNAAAVSTGSMPGTFDADDANGFELDCSHFSLPDMVASDMHSDGKPHELPPLPGWPPMTLPPLAGMGMPSRCDQLHALESLESTTASFSWPRGLEADLAAIVSADMQQMGRVPLLNSPSHLALGQTAAGSATLPFPMPRETVAHLLRPHSCMFGPSHLPLEQALPLPLPGPEAGSSRCLQNIDFSIPVVEFPHELG